MVVHEQHYHFNYTFSDDEGINFGHIFRYNKDLLIYYNPCNLEDSHYIDCWCSRWDVDNYNVIVETWITKDDYKNLMGNIAPGAVDELYEILGKKHYFDTTWNAGNTLVLYPNKYSQKHRTEKREGKIPGNLTRMRRQTVIYPKNITTNTINEDWIGIKIEGNISSNSEL